MAINVVQQPSILSLRNKIKPWVIRFDDDNYTVIHRDFVKPAVEAVLLDERLRQRRLARARRRRLKKARS